MLLKLEKMGERSERGIIRITGDPISILILMIMRYIGTTKMDFPNHRSRLITRKIFQNLSMLGGKK